MKVLEVILKTVETCNINCSYCYFFRNSQESFQIRKGKEKIISLSTVKEVAQFLKNGQRDLGLDKIIIAFHGGEPLLQNKEEFKEMCEIFVQELASLCTLELFVQTNGICISKEWIELFSLYKIRCGVSIDGHKECHDFFRKGFSGKGTYDHVVRGIKLIETAEKNKMINGFGTISVINPKFSAKFIYQHFTKELGIRGMDFLLPDFNHDTFMEHLEQTGLTVEDYGKFLCDLFDVWVNDDDATIDIRFFTQKMRLLADASKKSLYSTDQYSEFQLRLPIITIYHDGSLSIEDTFITTMASVFNKKNHVSNIKLRNLLNTDAFIELKKMLNDLPTKCNTCKWLGICGGGVGAHRYKSENNFKNPSIYCEALMKLYSRIVTYMIYNGLPMENVYSTLFTQPTIQADLQ